MYRLKKRSLISKLSSLSADVIPISRNNLLDTIPTLYEEFDVSFELYVNKAPGTIAKRSVIRLTNTNKDKGNSGERLATIIVSTDLTRVHFSSAAEGPKDTTFKYTTSSLNSTWVTIRFQQAVIDDRFKLIFWYNGVAIRDEVIDKPSVYNNTKVFVGDNFYPPLPGTVKNLVITTGMNFFSLPYKDAHRKKNVESRAQPNFCLS